MSNNNLNFKFSKRYKLPVILQNEIAECGHACIVMISNYWGHQLDLTALNKLRRSSIKGITMLDIDHLFQDLGFKTRALRINLKYLKFIRLPAILHWDMNHFVVLKKVAKNHIIIHDPATGVKRCTETDISACFTGIALEVEKDETFKRIISTNKLTLYHFMKMAKGINKFIIFLILLSLSIEILSLLNPLLIQYVTDGIITTNNINNLYTITFAFLILILLQSIIEYSRSYMIIYVTNHLTEKFSANLVKHLFKLPLDFFTRRHKGDIQSKFQSIDQIQKKISTDFINTILDGLMITINLVVMIIYSLKLTLIVCFNLFFFLVIRYLSYRSLKSQTEASIAQHAKTASLF